MTNTVEATIRSLIARELIASGFESAKDAFSKGSIKVDLEKRTVKDDKTDVVIALNDGFLCSYTLRQLFDFKNVLEKKDSVELMHGFANLFVMAGINPDKEIFVSLFHRAFS